MARLSKVQVWSAAAGAAGILIAGTALRAASAGPAALEGVWRTAEVTVQGPAPQTFKPTATLAIFHGRHYSRVEVHAEGPRPILKDPVAASADELRATWGPFVSEAGTSELRGNAVTMQALVAKNPAAMAKGATSVYTYEQHGDSVTLTQVRTPVGPVPVPITIRLVRVE